MAWFLSFFYFALILYFLPKISLFKNSDLKIWDLRGLYTLKVLAGIVLWLIYFYYYGNDRSSADAFRFFDDATIIYRQLTEKPLVYFKILFGVSMNDPDVLPVIEALNNWYKPYNQGVYNDNQSIIRFNAFCMLFSFGFFHVHTVLINLFSFFGLVALYRVFRKELVLPKYLLIAGLFFVPQVWLWASGVLKEGLLIGGMGLFFFGLWHLFVYKSYNLKNFLAFIAGLIVLSLVKNYIILCFLPAILFLIYHRLVFRESAMIAALGALLTSILAFSIISWIPSFSLLENIVSKQVDFIRLAIMSDSGSYFEIYKLKPSLLSFFRGMPEAFFNANLRPFLWDSSSALERFSSIESLLLTALIISSVLIGIRLKAFNSRLFLFSLLFYLCLFVLIGLVTPVAGAVVRYKIPALLFMVPISLNILYSFIHAQSRT